jgi:endonuclease/exonuclease/phosphatase (EEP) superfamily protein YafD
VRRPIAASRPIRLCAVAYLVIAGVGFAAFWIPALSLIQAPALQLGLLGMIVAAAATFVRRFAVAAMIIAASAIFWIPVAPFLLASTEGEPMTGATVKIALLETSNAAAVNYILQSRPDIVVIADPSSPKRDRRSDLDFAYPARLDSSDESGGPLILARRDLQLDLLPSLDTEFQLLRARVVLGQASFDLAVVHLDRPWPFSSHGPDQVAQLAAGLADETRRLIVIGDFNRPPWMSDMKVLNASLGVFAKAAPGTWPSWLPRPLRLPLDLVLVGNDVALSSVQLGPSLGSDHLPLIATVVWPDDETAPAP